MPIAKKTRPPIAALLGPAQQSPPHPLPQINPRLWVSVSYLELFGIAPPPKRAGAQTRARATATDWPARRPHRQRLWETTGHAMTGWPAAVSQHKRSEAVNTSRSKRQTGCCDHLNTLFVKPPEEFSCES